MSEVSGEPCLGEGKRQAVSGELEPCGAAVPGD